MQNLTEVDGVRDDFVGAYQTVYAVATMCRMPGVSSSGYSAYVGLVPVHSRTTLPGGRCAPLDGFGR